MISQALAWAKQDTHNHENTDKDTFLRYIIQTADKLIGYHSQNVRYPPHSLTAFDKNRLFMGP